MAKLFRRVQLGTALETTTASKPTDLETTVANYDIAALDLDFSPDIESFDREFARTSTTRVKGTQGQKAVGISFRTELVGTTSGAFGTVPGFGKVLQAGGMRQEAHDTIDLDDGGTLAITGGPFRHGEIIDLEWQGGGSGGIDGTATVIHDTHNGDTVMYIYDLTTFDAASATGYTSVLLTGQSTGATVDLTDVTDTASWGTEYTTNIGYSWWPISQTLKSIGVSGAKDADTVAGNVLEGDTSGVRIVFDSHDVLGTDIMGYFPIRGTFLNGETLTDLTENKASGLTVATATQAEQFEYGGTIAAYANLDGTGVVMLGARTNVGLVCEVNRQVFIQVESRGFFDSVTDLPLLTSDTISSATPPLWQGTDTFFADNEANGSGEEDRDAEIIPCLSGLELSLGNQFGDRRCASASAGLEEVIVQQRQGTINVKTEATFEADLDFLGKLQSGVVMRTRFTVGTVPGNQFYVTAPGLQYESAGQENANGLRVYNMGGKLTGGALWNLNGAVPAEVVLSGVGGDNELVISYITTA